MLKSKTAMESYILALMIVSVVMGLFLVFILGGIYGQDNINCNSVVFEIKDFCKKDSSLQFNIENKWNSTLDFKINEKFDPLNYKISPSENKEIRILLGNDFVNVIPIIKVEGENFICNGKLQRMNTEIIGKC